MYKVMQSRHSETRFSPIYGAIQTVQVKVPTLAQAIRRATTWAKRYGKRAIVIECAGKCPVVFSAQPTTETT